MSPEPLTADLLYRVCDVSAFDFQTTSDLADLPGLVGQARARCHPFWRWYREARI